MSTNKNNNNNNNNNSILDNVLKGLVTLVFAALAGTVSGNVHSNANEMKRRNNTDNIEKLLTHKIKESNNHGIYRNGFCSVSTVLLSNLFKIRK